MNEIYVIPFYGNWAIKLKGKQTPLSTHNRKDEAVRIAAQLSKKHRARFTVLEEDSKDN